MDVGLLTLLAALALGAITSLAVCAAKGRWLLFGLGFLLTPLVATMGAVGLATPDSWWARRFYGPEKMARARERYGANEAGASTA